MRPRSAAALFSVVVATSCLLGPSQASADYIATAFFIPYFTPTCPPKIRGFAVGARTGVSGLEISYVDLVQLKTNLHGPGYEVHTIPEWHSVIVNEFANTVAYDYTRNPAEAGRHTFVTYHQWVYAIVGNTRAESASGSLVVDPP